MLPSCIYVHEDPGTPGGILFTLFEGSQAFTLSLGSAPSAGKCFLLAVCGWAAILTQKVGALPA